MDSNVEMNAFPIIKWKSLWENKQIDKKWKNKHRKNRKQSPNKKCRRRMKQKERKLRKEKQDDKSESEPRIPWLDRYKSEQYGPWQGMRIYPRAMPRIMAYRRIRDACFVRDFLLGEEFGEFANNHSQRTMKVWLYVDFERTLCTEETDERWNIALSDWKFSERVETLTLEIQVWYKTEYRTISYRTIDPTMLRFRRPNDCPLDERNFPTSDFPYWEVFNGLFKCVLSECSMEDFWHLAVRYLGAWESMEKHDPFFALRRCLAPLCIPQGLLFLIADLTGTTYKRRTRMGLECLHIPTDLMRRFWDF